MLSIFAKFVSSKTAACTVIPENFFHKAFKVLIFKFVVQQTNKKIKCNLITDLLIRHDLAC